MSKTIKEIPNTAKLFKDGWGEEIAVALLNSAEMYVISFATNGAAMSEHNIRDIQNLIMLFRAGMKDVTNIDLEDPESVNL